jgi:hypothetical protein
MTTPAIRSALRQAFGDRQYRITAAGEIFVKGKTPDSESIGWYLYGFTWDPATIRSIEALHPNGLRSTPTSRSSERMKDSQTSNVALASGIIADNHTR